VFDHKARRIDETWDIQMFGLVTPERTVKVLEDVVSAPTAMD
jgi:hypothetical protein